MSKKDYKKQFDDEIQNLQDLAKKSSTKISYGDIIAKKLVLLYQDHSVNKEGWEYNSSLAATLVPEWSQSLARITTEYAGVNTDGTPETENEDFEKYYNEHPSKRKPLYKWRAPLVVKFEFQSYEYPVTAYVEKHEARNMVDKLLDYDEALDNFTQHMSQQDNFLAMLTKDQLMVDYIVLQENTDESKKDEVPYVVVSDKQSGHINEKHKQELQDKKAFTLKKWKRENGPKKIAAVLKTYPATTDLYLDSQQLDFLLDDFVEINSEQEKVVSDYLSK